MSWPPTCLHDEHCHDAVNGKNNLILSTYCTSLMIYWKGVELLSLFPHSLCNLFITLKIFTLSDWCYVCHCVWCDPLPDLHQSCSSYELQSNHTESCTTNGQNYCSHHQPGGHPHTGRGVWRCGTMAHCTRYVGLGVQLVIVFVKCTWYNIGICMYTLLWLFLADNKIICILCRKEKDVHKLKVSDMVLFAKCCPSQARCLLKLCSWFCRTTIWSLCWCMVFIWYVCSYFTQVQTLLHSQVNSCFLPIGTQHSFWV